jgi:hypothetical protein
MKRISCVVLALLVSAAMPFVAPTHTRNPFAVHAASGCTNASLSGNYGFTFSGFQLQSPGVGKGHGKSVPFYGTGLVTFDGAESFSLAFTFSQNGALPGDTYVTSTASFTGTYTVNHDCTGIFIAAPGSGGDNGAFVIVRDGAEVLATSMSEPDTLNLDAKKQ